MIRELPVEPVVAALATLPINVLLAVGEHMVAGKRQPLFNRTDTAAALLGDRSRIHTVLNLHIWAPESDDERRPGSLVEAGTSSTRELPDDVVRTSRFLGLPDRDGSEPDKTVRYDVVHCIGSIGRSIGQNYGDDPLMFLGVGRHLILSPGTLRDALVRCGTRLLILQSLGYHYRGDNAERLAEFVAGAGGPAVLVVADDERHDVNAYLRDLYGRILGNQPIEEAAAAGGPETLFAHGTGGHRLLRFDSMMERLEQQLRDYAGLVDELLYGIRNLERGGLAARHVASDDELRSLHKLQLWIGAALAELARARTSVGAHVAEGAILLAAVVAEASRIKAEIAHGSGEGHLHTKFDMLAYRIGEALRELKRVATVVPPSAATSLVPASERQISAWISELDQSPDEPLLVGHAYTLNFKVGNPIPSSLITGADAYVSSAEVPEQGLDTKWAVMSRDVDLAALSPEATIKTRRVGNAQSWTAQFDLHIPKGGESAVRQLRITPRHARIATLDIHVFSRGELFRQFLVELSVASVAADDRSNGTLSVAIKDDIVLTLPGELGLQPQHEWQTPPGKLQIIVVDDDSAYVQGSIFTDEERLDIGDSTEWHTSQTVLNGPITNVRRAAERFREDFESYLNGIEPTDLAARLANFQPVYTWDEAHDRADSQTDRAHTEAWEQVRQSERLRDLAAEGYVLYQRLFPAGSDLRKWLDGLTPGHLLDIRWTQKDRAGVSSIPWSLVYMADPDDPIDPLRFMGLRFRLSYWAHPMSPTSQALGDPATTYRAHLLYWGSGETDAASVEARWQRDLWAGLDPQVVTGPTSAAPKSALLQVIRTPAPVPMTVLYLFCHCDVGEGNEVVLRFGGTKNREDIIRQTELPNKPFEKGPLVFANACTTAASDPTIANELETRFFERGCRAFIGTETKVPIRFASRFAAIFFHFFYRCASETPMAAGEAVAQTRLFLWTHYKNIGGILYSYINRYDVLLAGDEELKALRVP